MGGVNVKRLLAIIALILIFAGGIKIYASYGKSSKNPYISQAEIVQIPDNINYANQIEKGMVIDIFAGTKTIVYNWKITVNYSGTITTATKYITSGTSTFTDVILATHIDRDTVTFIHAGPSGNTASTITTTSFVLQWDLLGNYPFEAHAVGMMNSTPVAIIFNPNATTAFLYNPSIVPYKYVRSFTTTISGVKHILVTLVTGEYTITSANYTTEILH